MAVPFILEPAEQGIELLYTFIVVVLCFLIYFKTKEIYDLTGHQGIKFFRYAFLFFGLAYVSRMFLYFLVISDTAFDLILPMKTVMAVSALVVGYLSTMALLYLTYNTVRKRIAFEHFLHISNVIALIIAGFAFVSRSTILVLMLQLLILVFAMIASFVDRESGKKRMPMRAIYFLIFVFWLVSLFIVGPRRVIPFEVTLASQVISIGVFLIIYYKVSKWVK